jgi:hypothetical protein
MGVLLANLKHLYQRRGLWIVYAGLGLVGWFAVEGALSAPTGGNGLFGGFLACCFLLGLLVGTIQMETASKPFSFCLPSHRDAVRRLVFLVGLAVSLAFFFIISIVLVASPSRANPLERSIMPAALLVLVLGSYFSASLAVYLLGADLAFSAVRSVSGMVMVAFGLSLCFMSNVFPTIQYPIVHWPVSVIALAWAASVASWWWLGRRAWFRRSCDRPWMGLFDPWDRKQAQKYRDLYATRFIKNIPPAWDRYFQGVIGRRPPSDPGKYAWGALYTTCVLVGPQWKGILTLALVWLAFGGYSRAAAPMVMGFLPLITVGFLQSPLGTALLVAGGRRERFFATVALILGFSIVWVLLFGVVVGLIHLLAPVVPAVTVRGYTLSLHAISFQVVWIPLVLVPVVGLVQTLFCRKPVWLALSIMLVTAILMLFTSPLGLYQAITPMVMSGAAVLTWGICLLILYRIALHSDLVRN